ncbi:MAG: tetratricopeptide repeat protein [Pyrinomonadaceae bacterium]
MKRIYPIHLFLLAMLSAALVLQAGCANGSDAASTTRNTVSPIESVQTDAEILNAIAATEQNPDAVNAYTNLAAIYIRKARANGDFSLNDKAKSAVEKALELDAKDLNARRLNASLLSTLHRFPEARESALALTKEFSADAFSYGVLTDANVELGNYDEALAAAQKMVDLKPNSSSYARVAHLRSLYGEHKGAVEVYKLAAKTADPADKEAQSWCLVQLGNEYWKYGKYKEAESVYDEALQVFPQSYMAMAGKGRTLASQGQYESAIKYLNDSMNRVPNADIAILLSEIYSKLGRQSEAEQQAALVEVIDKKLGKSGDQRRLAMFWADRGMNLQETLEIAQREAASRNDIFTADTLAWALYKNGKIPEAAEAIKKAMRLKTNDAGIYYHAGMIEKASGNEREAKRLLELSLKTNPNFDLIQSEIAKQTLEAMK